jgi:antitoxin YefM
MTTLSVADARANFSRLVESAETTHERFEVTRNGSRVAVILGADDFDSLVETLAILTDQELTASMREADAAIARGEVVTGDDLRERLRAAGRLPE